MAALTASNRLGFGDDLVIVVIDAHILRPGFQGQLHQGILFNGAFSITMYPFLLNIQATHPLSPMLPPCLVRAWRISETARFLLSVSESIRMAAPPGP
jgi:hypothetical protein